MATREPSSFRPLWYLCGLALLVGVYGRFKGLGTAPLTVDEYYLTRSIENVLRTGVPLFSCGGYYIRGLVLQYLAAAERGLGMSAELAPRLISALCSLAALPAVYLIGQRLRGSLVAILAVGILALSVWEIEMARFGRMYAPFQMVFLWYLVYFLRATLDEDQRARWVMIALSIAGPLVWEGGVFLLLANLLPVFLQSRDGRIARRSWLPLAAGIVLLAVGYWFVTFDFRQVSGDAWPVGYDTALVAREADAIGRLTPPLWLLPQHPAWLAVALLPAAALLGALPWVWSKRPHPLLAAGLMIMLLAAAVHQFLAVAALGLLLLLMRYIGRNDLLGRPARPLHVALGVCVAFWVAFGIASSPGWHGARQGLQVAAMVGYQFVRVPDLIGVVVRPWARTLPFWGLVLFLMCGAALLRMAIREEQPGEVPLSAERVILVVFLVLLLAASAAHPPRQETRYVFNLYPLAILIALTTLSRIVQAFTRRPALAAGATTLIAFSGFAVSEDFQPSHLRYIDGPKATFRVGMSGAMQSHLVIREDYRALAQWLRRSSSPGTVLINSVHGLDYYYPGFQYFYVERNTTDFEDWACRRGTMERWGQYPLLDSVANLNSAIRSAPHAYLVAFDYESAPLLARLAPLHPEIKTSRGHIIVVELRGR